MCPPPPMVLDYGKKISLGSGPWSKCVKYELGRGNNILFWLDDWVDEGILKDHFPKIFAVAQSQGITIGEAWGGEVTDGGWNVVVSRHLNDWEGEEYEIFFFCCLRLKFLQKMTNWFGNQRTGGNFQ